MRTHIILNSESVDTKQFHTHLVCDMQQDFTVEILTNISEAYGCEKKVDNIDINMNGYQWAANFSSDLIGDVHTTHI